MTTRPTSAESLNPQPRAWPRCSDCKVPYVLRRAITFRAPAATRERRLLMAEEWIWQHDCKHHRTPPELSGARSSKKPPARKTFVKGQAVEVRIRVLAGALWCRAKYARPSSPGAHWVWRDGQRAKYTTCNIRPLKHSRSDA